MSPDWSTKEEPVPYVKLDNPQTLNLYSYVVNNPMRSNDPDGHGFTDPDLCRAITNAVSQGGSIQDGWNNYLSGQQQVGDPTLPTSSQGAQNFNDVSDNVESALTNSTAMNAALLVGTDGIGDLAEAGMTLFNGADEAYSVYRVTEEGETTYVGITNNLERRAAEHGKQLEEIAGGLSKQEARGTEQALIEHHGLGKNGGTLTNKINSIARTNSIYTEAVTFGRQLLQSLSYLPIP